MSVNRKVTVPLGRSSIRSALHGKPCPERVPALGPRARFDLASVDRDAFAHPDEAVAAASPSPPPSPSSRTEISTAPSS